MNFKDFFLKLLTRKFIVCMVGFIILIINAIKSIGIDEWSIVSIVSVFIAGNSAEHLSNRNSINRNQNINPEG